MIPILYSFRRCPYAIRARLALQYCHVRCELIEVKLSNKPAQMSKLSPKGTVPVLHLKENNMVLEESLDIMLWALAQNPTQSWLPTDKDKQNEIFEWIEQCDNEFKPWLDKFKYADRFPEHESKFYFQKASQFLKSLQSALQSSSCLGGEQYNLADMAILPFVRQFASVDRARFDKAFPDLVSWLETFLSSDLFNKVMVKNDFWQEGQSKVYFP